MNDNNDPEYDSEEHHDELNTIFEIDYKLKKGDYAAAQKYLIEQEKEHNFTVEEFLPGDLTLPREKPWEESFVKEKLLPVLLEHSKRADQNFVIRKVIERLMVLHSAFESGRQDVNWEYINLEYLGGGRTYGCNPQIHEVTVTFENPMIIDADRDIISATKDYQKGEKYNELIAQARKQKHDGLIIKNSTARGQPRTEYLIFDFARLALKSREEKLPAPSQEK